MTPRGGPVLFLTTKGLPIPTKVPHQRSYCFNHVGKPCTVPSQFIATYLKGTPRSGLGSIVTPIQTHKDKANQSSNWKHYDELFLRSPSLIRIPSRVASSVIGGNRTDCLWNAGSCLRLFSQNVEVSKSRHRLLFYPTRKGQKHRKIPFWDISRVREVDYRKGRC